MGSKAKAFFALVLALLALQAQAYTQNIGNWIFTWPGSGGTANYVMTTNGSGGVGTWSQVALGSAVTGVLPLANGGSNKALTPVAGALVQTDGDSMEVGAVGATGQVLTSGGSGAYTWTTNASGDVTGPASATDEALARFDTTTGKLLQNSAATLGDTGAFALSSTAVSLTVSDSANANTRKMVYDPAAGAQLDIFAANAAGQISGMRQQGRPSAANGVVGRYTAQFNDGTFPCVTGTNCTAIGRIDWQSTTSTPVQAGGNFIGSLAETATATGLFPSMIIHQSARNAFWGFAAGSQSATAGLDNTAIGHKALRSLMSTGSGGSGGNRNTGIGASALSTGTSNQLTGSDNVGVGYNACNTTQAGSGNTCVGADADVFASGTLNSAAIGAGAVVNTDNKMVFGNSDVLNWVLGSHRTTSGQAPLRGLQFGNSAGTDTDGGAAVIADSAGTGTAAGGGLYFAVSMGAVGSGSVSNTAAQAMSILPGVAAVGSTVNIMGQATQSANIFDVKQAAGGTSWFSISAAGAVGVSGSVGSTGQVLTSTGPTAPPTWTTPAGASGATGSVQFADGGAFASDNANFFWDDTNDRLGVGTATPTDRLDVNGDVILRNASGAQPQLKLSGDPDSSPNEYIALQAPGGSFGGYPLTLPEDDGDPGEFLQTNGSGVTSWEPAAGASGATGSVQFADGGAFASDNANFFWDDTNNRLGIGTNSPSVPLEVAGVIQAESSGDYVKLDPSIQAFDLFKSGSHGTRVSSTTGATIAFNDFGNTGQDFFKIQSTGFMRIDNIESGGINGNTFAPLALVGGYYPISTSTPAISMRSFDTPGNTDQYHKLDIYNGDDGKIILQPNGSGYVGVGTTAPAVTLDVSGGIRTNTTTTKPTCDATVRGTQWVDLGGAGVTDELFMCLKAAADTYSWVSIVTGG